ncbi:hypothetical protein DesfrDRAFT_0100 [Solidesulfovibrio fructosivorans JJ]]|uniref:Uncharacterized protein n=1 Tax=Solidesulfovibrio fructosivorans JJ] TaxID=596151 RepID=E1JR51_SOLFR|nr:hypothetical protein [Solidesulfovibrio fructosivorans]EFL53052.1 hypothetical protein DesfrDRAFT_0100 [Solidesulfovibrio fructosivorans JJ]]
MGQEARDSILARLKTALRTRGAKDAVDRLDLITCALTTEMDAAAFYAWVMRYCREYDLDPDWVFDGKGRDAPPDCPVAMTPVFAMSSTHPRTGRWLLREIERIALAPRIVGPSRFVIRMDSPALEPRIRKGAYLVVDTRRDAVDGTDAALPTREETVPFAMDIQGKGLVVRMLPYGQGADRKIAGKDDSLAVEDVVTGDIAGHARIVGRVVWVAQTL